MTYLTAFVELFRFIKRYRERAEARYQREADERAEERAHQRAMLETIFTKMVESQKVQSESILALAESQRANAQVMTTWLDGFKIADPTPARPSVAKPDQEEWVKEALELQQLGLADIDLNELPPEFQLAYALAHQREEASDDEAM